jgi:hypothetical protein
VAKKAQELFNKYFDASSDHAVNIEDAELQRVSYFLTESTKKVSVEFQFNKIFKICVIYLHYFIGTDGGDEEAD